MLKLKIFIAGLICRLFSRKKINGQWVNLPKEVSIAFWPFKNHIVEAEECKAIKKYGKRGGVFVDIGANVGLLTLDMMMQAGSKGKVIAFEPNPATYCMLNEVVKINNKYSTPITCIQSVLGEATGTTEFYISNKDYLGVMSAMHSNDPDAYPIRLPVITLDQYFLEEDHLDFLKIDAEGAELMILKGAGSTLSRFKPVVQVEVHGEFMKNMGSDVSTLFDFMIHKGYKIINLVTEREITLEEFQKDTGVHATNPLTGKDMAYESYGQLVFIPN